eukprot:4610300-Pleurochrysis_carterae.AAC.3
MAWASMGMNFRRTPGVVRLRASEVYSEPSARIDACLRVGLARLDGEGSAPEGKYGHDTRFHSRE